jgi:hypothetical protein
MSIQESIENNCLDKAVYWGNPINDGRNFFTFNDAIEISCRWEDISQIVTDNKGKEITSRALVFVLQDLDVEGYLYHGTLEELYDSAESSADAIADPKNIDGTYIIKRFQKVPSLDGEGFLRKAYLTPSLSFGGF